MCKIEFPIYGLNYNSITMYINIIRLIPKIFMRLYKFKQFHLMR